MSGQKEEQYNEAIAEVRRLLKVWADWLRSYGGGYGCRGYPNSVAFIHAFEPREDNTLPAFDNEEAQRVERAMCALKAFNRRCFLALLYEYYAELTNREGAEQLNVSEPTFRAWRAYGENYVAGYLTKGPSEG